MIKKDVRPTKSVLMSRLLLGVTVAHLTTEHGRLSSLLPNCLLEARKPAYLLTNSHLTSVETPSGAFILGHSWLAL